MLPRMSLRSRLALLVLAVCSVVSATPVPHAQAALVDSVTGAPPNGAELSMRTGGYRVWVSGAGAALLRNYCVQTWRTTVSGRRKEYAEETACSDNDAYRFNIVNWTASLKTSLPSYSRRETFVRTGRHWKLVRVRESWRERVTTDLHWTATGPPRVIPRLSLIYWPTEVRRSAIVTGSVKFGGLGLKVPVRRRIGALSLWVGL